jgi:AcrR family transcriptional regulator
MPAPAATSVNKHQSLVPESRPTIDRRRLRSARTRQAIIEAYLALLREDPQIPTSVRIAERAGCSVRSIFERFVDLHALRLAATDYAFAEALSEVAANAANGSREERIRSHVQTRGAICARWLPLWRALNANRGHSPELNSRVVLIRQAILKRIELMYRPELSALPEQQRHHVMIVVESLIDFESWGRMRDDNGLSFDDACAVWSQAIDRLLPPTPLS